MQHDFNYFFTLLTTAPSPLNHLQDCKVGFHSVWVGCKVCDSWRRVWVMCRVRGPRSDDSVVGPQASVILQLKPYTEPNFRPLQARHPSLLRRAKTEALSTRLGVPSLPVECLPDPRNCMVPELCSSAGNSL